MLLRGGRVWILWITGDGTAETEAEGEEKMTPLEINGLLMPPDFPRELFEKIYSAAKPHQANPTHPQFIGAWSAVSHRYKALAEYDERFTRSIEKGPARTHEVRHEEERDLFGFASNVYSVFEAFHYGMFAIGAFIEPNIFVLATPSDETKVSVAATHKKYAEAFPSDPVLASFKDYLDDPARRDLSLLRNVLTHRAVPPRAYGVSVGQSDLSWARITRVEIPLDKNTTKSRREAASRLLTICLNGADAFVTSKL
jgi:hypothetical protein